MKLMIGSGSVRREGWKTLDAKPGVDFMAVIPPMPEAVKTVAWDEIEWVHGITSLYPWDAAAALKELRDMLAPDGVLALEQPDARKCDPATKPEWLFGDPAPRDPLHMNKWTYTPASLRELLIDVGGFWKIVVCPAQYHLPERDFRIEAYRCPA